MKDILGEITYLREKRGWTEYQLAESSGLPQSTISSWYRKKVLPSVPSLDKICSAFGISLSQLFSEDDDHYDLTEEQKKMLACLTKLDNTQREALLQFLEKL